MALEPSGGAASDQTSGAESEVRETSLPVRTPSGFAETSALFRGVDELPLELRALRGLVDLSFLRWARERAETLGITADAVIRRSGVLHPDAMTEAYAADLGIDVDPLDDVTTAGFDVEPILARGLLPADPRREQNRPAIVLGGDNLKALYGIIRATPALARNVTGISGERLRSYLERSSAEKLAREATFGLQNNMPAFSAGLATYRRQALAFLAVFAIAAISYSLSWKPVFFAIEALLALVFLTWAVLRVYACTIPKRVAEKTPLRDSELPIYSVLIPLHREAKIVPDLVEAVSALNYPREKLDVKLILEADDKETLAAIRAITLDPCFEIVIAPPTEPRTKPKALRAALPFVRGEFVVVFDAEDRPEPDQLRDAFARFRKGPAHLACVQAKLAIDNKRANFLTAHFRAEYSGLFDVLLPALATLQLPVPLGGTSNHFRVEALRAVGSWDPFNVTEDADLGVRLARFGYLIDVVDSTTWEEAPARLGAWLMQRTRWMKGWLQTYVVHMRHPALLFRQLGTRGFLAFQLLIGGTVLAALVHPIFFVWLMKDLLFGELLMPSENSIQTAQKSLVIVTLAGGYLASALLGFFGLWRRRLYVTMWIHLTIPIYWLLLSAAAWRAVWKLLTAPYQWEKTEHGIAQRCRKLRRSSEPAA